MSQFRTPKYRKQAGTSATQADRAFVEIDGDRRYLGEWNTPESRQAYDRVIAEWLANGRRVAVAPTPDQANKVTVVEIVHGYWEWAKGYYRKPDGTPTSGLEDVRYAIRPLKNLYGDTPAVEFGPKKLRVLREWLIKSREPDKHGNARPLNRKTVNGRIGVIKHVFKWAAGQEIIPPSTWQSLAAVENLRRGRSDAAESAGVRPAPRMLIEAMWPHCSKQVQALTKLQLLTGARPGELVGLRRQDIDKAARPGFWLVNLTEHKTAHHGHTRTIPFNPEAQQVLAPFMTEDRPADAPLFSPREAEEERRAARHAERVTPLCFGNKPGSSRCAKPQRPPKDRYTVASYRRAIQRACLKAFPYPPELCPQRQRVVVDGRKRWQCDPLTKEQEQGRAKWLRNHTWRPNQLRHNAATQTRAAVGIEVSRALLGHRSTDTTQIYAEMDLEKTIAASMTLSLKAG